MKKTTATNMQKQALKISKPYLKHENEKVRMYAKLSVNELTYDAYFEVDKKYEEYLTPELSDGFLVNVLLYAMENNYDIECEGEVSEKLHYQISSYLMPTLNRNIPKYKTINISAKLANYVFNAQAVGTGLSCGVDSFYTTLKHIYEKKYSKNILTHLCFFNAGASGGKGGERPREIYLRRGAVFSKTAKKLNCEFVMVDTNINEFINQDHLKTHAFRTLAIPLLMQKLFNKYYYSAGFMVTDFAIVEDDTAYFDLLTVPCLSTSNTEFVLAGGEKTRLGKIDYISNYNITHTDLNVCIKNDSESNCSHCPKCKKTMLGLYLLGKLDLYKNIFDTDYFYKNKDKMIAWSLVYKNKNVDIAEISKELKKQKKIKIYHRLICLVRKTQLIFKKR